MKRRRISRVGIAGILAVVSAFGLVAVLSLSNGALKQINPTEQQETVEAIVRTRLTQTAEMRLSATPEVTETQLDPIWATATALKQMIDAGETDYPFTSAPMTIAPLGLNPHVITETVTPAP